MKMKVNLNYRGSHLWNTVGEENVYLLKGRLIRNHHAITQNVHTDYQSISQSTKLY